VPYSVLHSLNHPLYSTITPPHSITMVCLSCPLVSIPHPLPGPKRVGIQIPPASYSPAPPSLLPILPTNPLHLIPSVTLLGYLEGPVLWLALYLLIILPCLTLSPPCQNKKDKLIPFFYMYDHNKTVYSYISMHISMNHHPAFNLYLP
jgi:hypothetical protein